MGRSLPVLNGKKAKPAENKNQFDCKKCPAYCCHYDFIGVSDEDIERLADHFGISFAQARQRYTLQPSDYPERIMRHKKDKIFKSVCVLLDQETRRCTVYKVRPWICGAFPDDNHCGYYHFLDWERKHQADKTYVPGGAL